MGNKKAFGEVCVKLNGSITNINKLSIEDFEYFLGIMEGAKRTFIQQKTIFEAKNKKNELDKNK